MERLLASRYQAVRGFTVRKKSGQSGAKWVNMETAGYICPDLPGFATEAESLLLFLFL